MLSMFDIMASCFRRASSRSAFLSFSTVAPTRSTRSSRGLLSIVLSAETSRCSRARYWYASEPTSASTRRTPEPMDPSEMKDTTPSCPLRCACVPPHNSCAQSPTDTTRTVSPYFSPNSAIAPISSASAWLM